MNTKKTGTRPMSAAEQKVDEALLSTHDKKVFSFTEEEKRHLDELNILFAYQQAVFQQMERHYLGLAVKRVGKSFDPSNTLYDLDQGVFLCYFLKQTEKKTP